MLPRYAVRIPLDMVVSTARRLGKNRLKTVPVRTEDLSLTGMSVRVPGSVSLAVGDQVAMVAGGGEAVMTVVRIDNDLVGLESVRSNAAWRAWVDTLLPPTQAMVQRRTDREGR